MKWIHWVVKMTSLVTFVLCLQKSRSFQFISSTMSDLQTKTDTHITHFLLLLRLREALRKITIKHLEIIICWGEGFSRDELHAWVYIFFEKSLSFLTPRFTLTEVSKWRPKTNSTAWYPENSHCLLGRWWIKCRIGRFYIKW